MKFRHPPESGQHIAVDLDGTLAHYDDWQGHLHIGAPIPSMVEHVKEWVSQGYTVVIFTARLSSPETVEEVTQAIGDWTEEHIGTRLESTCIKDFRIMVFFDDRAIQVEKNTGKLIL